MKGKKFIEKIVDDSYPSEITPSDDILNDLARQVVEDIKDKGYPDEIKGEYTYDDGGDVIFSLEFVGFPYTRVVSAPDGKWNELYDVVPVGLSLVAVGESDEQSIPLSKDEFRKRLSQYLD